MQFRIFILLILQATPRFSLQEVSQVFDFFHCHHYPLTQSSEYTVSLNCGVYIYKPINQADVSIYIEWLLD